MIAAVAWLTLVQAGSWVVSPTAPTVGDTLTIARTIPITEAGVRVRIEPLTPTDVVEPLRDPTVDYGADGIHVQYVVAVFQPARQVIAMPELELVYPTGSVETIPGGEVAVDVRSVLPAEDSLPPPKFSQGPIARRLASAAPAVLLAVIVAVTTGGWAWWRRRPLRRPVWGANTTPSPVDVPITRWLAAGEPRAVAAHLMARFREGLADIVPEIPLSLSVDQCVSVLSEVRPDGPVRQVADVMHGLERASYAPAVPSDVLLLGDEADELLDALKPAEADET